MTEHERENGRKSRIPIFSSWEEEAAWWDSHDLADYQDEFETVGATFADKLSDQGVDERSRKMA